MAPTPTGTARPDNARNVGARQDSKLDERYGRTRSFRLRRRVIAIIVGGGIVVVFGAWVIFAAFDGTSASIDSNDAGYVIHDANNATVTSEISVDAGTRVDCSIEVLNSGFDVVGWKVVDFPASSQSSNVYTTDIKTTSRGVTGLIDKCWLP
ncbi:DUF4307 domain-containing protein [Frondihabitans cladoniiphilus]|uniref:DUF4307 domain-containing protein n=1 Tax=Frondihabitans cladoniiphilus TaxID=715785 RepID=A0ABP8VSK9_9MICO